MLCRKKKERQQWLLWGRWPNTPDKKALACFWINTACFSKMNKQSDNEKWALFLRRLLEPKSNRTSVWRNNLKSYLEDFCPPRFSATGFFFFFFRWKEGDEKIRCQVWKKVNMNANYPQSKTNPYPEGGEEGGGDVIWMLSWRFDIWEERDFKKWTLINQWMVSNQTSKPSMQKG